MKNPQLKKAYSTDEYTPEMIQELIKSKQDPVYFIKNYVKVQHPVKGNVPFNLFEYQERFIQHMQNNRFTITLQPRQCGKCVFFETPVNSIKKPSGFRKILLRFLDKKVYDAIFQNMP